jgi:hypothetical protein
LPTRLPSLKPSLGVPFSGASALASIIGAPPHDMPPSPLYLITIASVSHTTLFSRKPGFMSLTFLLPINIYKVFISLDHTKIA